MECPHHWRPQLLPRLVVSPTGTQALPGDLDAIEWAILLSCVHHWYGAIIHLFLPRHDEEVRRCR
ncbi:hypothetical protein BC832DRAFT_553202 [Gaertneriomyces semiglobifer]|nr:hypothetical protein BC832DRAFT_553202 [Gaertneriomyces semiglobifer]